MNNQQYNSQPSYRLSDISISNEPSKLAQITSEFVLGERAKDKRIYDETGCWFVCNCQKEYDCEEFPTNCCPPNCDCNHHVPCHPNRMCDDK